MNNTQPHSGDDHASGLPDSAEITDTHERAREAAEEQITKDQNVQIAQNEVVYSALNFWEEYFESDYAKDVKIRIRSDLPLNLHNEILYLLTQVPEEIEATENPFTKILCIITIGLYKESEFIQATDKDFWNDSNNWSLRKVQNVISQYLRNYTEGMNEVTSFLASKT